MKSFLSRLTLKTVFYLFTFSTLSLLCIVLFLGSKQYFLYDHCEEIVHSSRNLLFQFTTIKEHINETLLLRRKPETAELILEIQHLNSEVNTVLDDILIPEEFKLAYISQVDLMNVVVSLRNIQNMNGLPSMEQIATISKQLRTINTKLTGFHQQISRYTRTKLLGLHRALVGVFALIISVVSIMLLLMNRYITSPMLDHCRSLAAKDSADEISLFTLHSAIRTLNVPGSPAGQDMQIQQGTDWNQEELTTLYRCSSIAHLLNELGPELTNLANGSMNYTQALLDLSEDLNLDKDTKTLLTKLFSEEQRMSGLLMHMVQLTCCNAETMPDSMPAQKMFNEISALIRGTLEKDAIKLTIAPVSETVILRSRVRDIQLVILSLIQNSRTAVKHQKGLSSPDHPGQIVLSAVQNPEDSMIEFILTDNGTTVDMRTESTNVSVNHPLNLGTHLLQTLNGHLDVERTGDDLNRYTITCPHPEKPVLP